MQMPPRPDNVDVLRGLFAKRTRLMDQWAKFCALPSRKGNISNIRGGGDGVTESDVLTVPRPVEAGGPWEIADRLTIFEAAVLYRDGYPHEAVIANYLVPDYPGGRRLTEEHHGLGFYREYMPDDFKNPVPRDVYLQLIDMVTTGALKPLKAAYSGPGEVDPFRTVIPLDAVLEIARSRGDAGSIVASLVSRSAAKTRAMAAKPRRSGLDYASTDAPLLAEMRDMVRRGNATGPFDAALAVAKRAVGHGTLVSKAKRLTARYSAALRAERDGED